MRIAALLAAKGTFVATVGQSVPVAEAVAELRRHDVGALVVSDDGSTVSGIVSERDVVRRIAERGPSILNDAVRSIMSTSVHCCSPEDEVESLMVTMTHYRIRHVPVVEGGVLAGIVSIGDVVKHRIDELEQERKTLVDYINAR